MSGTLRDIVDKKQQTEKAIRKLLQDLEKDSECEITGVYLEFTKTIGRSAAIRDVEIKMELPRI